MIAHPCAMLVPRARRTWPCRRRLAVLIARPSRIGSAATRRLESRPGSTRPANGSAATTACSKPPPVRVVQSDPRTSPRRPDSSNTLYAQEGAEDVRGTTVRDQTAPRGGATDPLEVASLQGFSKTSRQDVPRCPEMSGDVRLRFHADSPAGAPSVGDDTRNASATSSASSLRGA
jgi:hypothetical protein